MLHHTRGLVAMFAAIAVLGLGAAPAMAIQDEGLEAVRQSTPVLLEAFLLRPMGLLVTVLGAVAFIPAGALVGITRPADLHKPFNLLVGNPFRYTFMDPLGEHPSSKQRMAVSRSS